MKPMYILALVQGRLTLVPVKDGKIVVERQKREVCDWL